MTKRIRLSDISYDQLKLRMVKGDSVDDVVKRLLAVQPGSQYVYIHLDDLTMALRDLTATLKQNRPPGQN